MANRAKTKATARGRESTRTKRARAAPADSTETKSRSQRLVTDLGVLIGKSRRLIWSAAARRLEMEGESMMVWNLLNHLVRVGPSTQREIAAGIAQHPAGVSRLLEEVERLGLVRRRRKAGDRRCIEVELTVRGRARFDSLSSPVFTAVGHVLGRLSPAERQQLRSLLIRLTSGDESESRAAAPK